MGLPPLSDCFDWSLVEPNVAGHAEGRVFVMLAYLNIGFCGCARPGSFMSEEVVKVAPEAAVSAPAVKITVRPNGSFRVEGPISLVDVNGNAWDLTGKPAISLCRCGLSAKRPFCDGSHGREGWKCEASPVVTEPVALG